MPSALATQWLISPNIEPLPSQDDLDRAVQAVENTAWAGSIIDRLIEVRQALLPSHPLDGHGDVEDFIERTWRLHQAIGAVGADHLWMDQHDGTMTRINGESAPVQDLLPRLGAMRSRSFCRSSQTLLSGICGVTIPTHSLAEDYFDSATFLLQNQRHAQVIDTHLEDLARAAAELVPRARDRRIWVKARASKSYLMRIQIPQGFELMGLNDQIETLLRLTDDRDPYGVHLVDVFISYEGCRRGLLVAPDVSMTREYRLFVVDGEVITGAGCIEADTPLLSSMTSPFSLRMERLRGDGEVTTDNAPLLQRYVGRARSLAEEFAQEGRRTFVLDLAYLEHSDQIVIVELNPLMNAGFYASNIELLYGAWSRRPEHFTPVHQDETGEVLTDLEEIDEI